MFKILHIFTRKRFCNESTTSKRFFGILSSLIIHSDIADVMQYGIQLRTFQLAMFHLL